MGKPVLTAFLPLALALLAVLALLAGCSTPEQQQGPGAEEAPGPPGGIPEDGRIELSEPELVSGGPSRGAPPPVWLVAGGEVVQASYGSYCMGDICMGEEPSRESGDVANAEVPDGEGVLVVVGSDGDAELSAGVVGWEEAPDVSTGGAVLTESGVPYFMNALDARLLHEGERPTVEPAPGAEGDRAADFAVFEVASAGNPGDRQLSVFLDTGGGTKPPAYHWRLDPEEKGENPPPEQEEFPGEVVELERGPGTVEYSSEEEESETEELLIRDVEKTPFGDGPFRIEAGEGYLWVLARDPQGRTLGSETGTKGKAGGFEMRVLLKVDPDTLEVLSFTDEPVFRATLEVGAGAAWLANGDEGTVVRVDPETGAAETIDVGGSPNGIAATEDGVWVSVYDDTQSGRVVRIDPRTAEEVAPTPN